MGSLSIWHWLIVLVVVVLVFGTKKLKNAGGDIGSAVKNFKNSMREGEDSVSSKSLPSDSADASSSKAESKAESKKETV